MSPEYAWAVNQVKVQRAKEQLANENNLLPIDSRKEITEEAIKARYIKLGGLVINPDEEEVKVVQESVRVVKKAKKSK